FRFAVDYASATNRSLVYAYSKLGRFAMLWLGVSFFVDIFIATAAVSLVTAGLLISVFNLPFSDPQVGVAVAVFSAVVLLNGHYAKAERVVKILVTIFSVLTVITMVFALPELGSGGRELFADVVADRPTLVFVIAMTGWMPLPLTGAIYLSMWAREKKAAGGDTVSTRSAVHDLHVGWTLMVVLALCFVVMGAAVLFQTNRETPASATAFANELMNLFTTVIGDWSYPLIAAAAIAVMWSSVFALMDAVPRVTTRLFDFVGKRDANATSRYTMFLGIQVVGVTIVMFWLLGSFGTFIDFATSAGFIAAPAIAYYNYRAVTSAEVASSYTPTNTLLVWHWIGLSAMAAFAMAFLAERFT
ncbi:MAG: hypothetical protein OEM25_02080, partial [Gammaproteobacteria bacterium]|nr:hypothetical protein [Gammaproteobacteria bacterium]